MASSLLVLSLLLLYYTFFNKKVHIPFSIHKTISKYNFPKSIILSRKIFIILLVIYSIFAYLNLSFPLLLSYQTKDTIIESKNIHFLVDISKSMFDLQLNNEIEIKGVKENKIKVVKEELLKTINTFQGNRIALLTFSWKSIINVSPTFDIKKIEQGIGRIVSDSDKVLSLPIYDDVNFNGTAIGNSLLLSSAFFNKDEKNIIILLTDGENNTGIKPLDTLEILKEKNVKVFTLGLMDETFDKKELETLSKETDGLFIDNIKVKNVSETINKISQQENKPVIVDRNVSLYNYIEITLIVLLISIALYNLIFYIGRKNIFYAISYLIILSLLFHNLYALTLQENIKISTNNLQNNKNNLNKILEQENKNHLYFLIDFSKTMEVIENWSSRIDKIKFLIENILKEISKDGVVEQKIGIVVFNLKSTLLLEWNWNQNFIYQYLKNLELDYGESIETDYNSLISSLQQIPNQSKLILLTDGNQYVLENEEIPSNITFLQYPLLKKVLDDKKLNLISIIGIGEEKQSLIPIWNNSYKTMQGKKIYSYLNKKEIESLWEQLKTKPIFYKENLKTITDKIKTKVREKEQKQTFYHYYLLIILLMILQIRSERLFR